MKALIFDLDDTLLNTAKKIGPRTRVALDRWLASGRRICFATSRPIRKVRAFLPSDLFQGCEIITMNGMARHSDGKLIYKAQGLGGAARAIVERFPFGHETRLTLELSGDEFSANYESSNEELLRWNAATRDMLLPLPTIDFEEVSKVCIHRLEGKVDHLELWLKDLGVNPIICDNGEFMNVVSCGIDKSTTLVRWLKEEGLKRGDFAIFGDDLPDIEMMQLSDHAVAMENASSEVKAVAHDIIGHCDTDCIGPYIERWL